MKTKKKVKKAKTVKLPKIGDEIVAVKIVGGKRSDYSGKVIDVVPAAWGGYIIVTEAGSFHEECLRGKDPALSHYAVKPKPAKKKTTAGPKVYAKLGQIVIVVSGERVAYNSINECGEVDGGWIPEAPAGWPKDYMRRQGGYRLVRGKRRAEYLKAKDCLGDTWQTAR